MSRIAKLPIFVPTNVSVNFIGKTIKIKGKKGELIHKINNSIKINYKDNTLTFVPRKNFSDGWAQAGTTRALINSTIIGVTNGFTRKLQLVGVGYRAIINEKNILSLFLGFSHCINYQVPKEIVVKCPSQTEIILSGIDKGMVSQVAANLRAYHSPEPYKGKGIRYFDENVRIKETKKK